MSWANLKGGHGPRLALILLLLTGVSMAVLLHEKSPERVAAGGTQASPSLSLPLHPYLGRLKTVRVRVAEHTLSFLLDTGGGETLITPQVAAQLGCTPFGRTVELRMSGERVEFQRCVDVTLNFDGLKLEHPEVGVFDLMALLPPGVPPLAGVVSLKSFASRTITLDWSAERLLVESDASARERVRDMTPLRMRLATGPGGNSLVAFLALRAKPAPLWLELDSGNLDHVLLSPPAARQLGLELRDESLQHTEGQDAGQDGSARRWDLPAVELHVEGLAPERRPVGVQELIHDGVLGTSFLEQYVLTLDLARGLAWGARRPAVEPVPGLPRE